MTDLKTLKDGAARDRRKTHLSAAIDAYRAAYSLALDLLIAMDEVHRRAVASRELLVAVDQRLPAGERGVDPIGVAITQARFNPFEFSVASTRHELRALRAEIAGETFDPRPRPLPPMRSEHQSIRKALDGGGSLNKSARAAWGQVAADAMGDVEELASGFLAAIAAFEHYRATSTRHRLIREDCRRAGDTDLVPDLIKIAVVNSTGHDPLGSGSLRVPGCHPRAEPEKIEALLHQVRPGVGKLVLRGISAISRRVAG